MELFAPYVLIFHSSTCLDFCLRRLRSLWSNVIHHYELDRFIQSSPSSAVCKHGESDMWIAHWGWILYLLYLTPNLTSLAPEKGVETLVLSGSSSHPVLKPLVWDTGFFFFSFQNFIFKNLTIFTSTFPSFISKGFRHCFNYLSDNKRYLRLNQVKYQSYTSADFRRAVCRLRCRLV